MLVIFLLDRDTLGDKHRRASCLYACEYELKYFSVEDYFDYFVSSEICSLFLRLS
jgi:hypothetical protein